MLRLHSFCQRVVEVGWLAAILIVPVAFDIYGFEIYLFPKVAIFRFITLLTLAAWLVSLGSVRNLKALNSAPSLSCKTSLDIRRFLAKPVIIPVLLFAAICILSTVTSLNPRLSLWGLHGRLQGAYTILCYILLFFLVSFNLRTKAQLERLITTVLLASLPVALGGILQHFGRNLMFPQAASRVSSTIGNPIFVGAYLIMVIPLAVARLLIVLGALREGSHIASSYRSMLLRAAGYASLLLAQLMCLLYTQARGPWLGCLAGITLFAVLLSLRRRIRWLLVVTIAMSVASIALLVLLNLPRTPLEPLRTLPRLSRLVILDDLKATTGTIGVRLLIWQGGIELLRSRPPVGLKPDPLSALRPLIGYGPEMMRGVFHAVAPPQLSHVESRNALADRAHNHLLDLIIMNGALGLAAFLFLIGSFFYQGISLLRQTNSFQTQLTLIALLAAVCAHFVETQVGIAITSTQMLLWLYMALLVVIHRLTTSSFDAVQTEPTVSAPLAFKMTLRDPNVRWLIYSLITAFILIFFATTTNINLIRADRCFQRCREHAAIGELRESLDACDKAIELSPNQPSYHRFRAEIFSSLAHDVPDSDPSLKTALLQVSERALTRARQLATLEAEYYADSGKLYGYWASTLAPSKFEQAVEFYNQAFQISPHDADFRNELAQMYFEAGHHEEAIEQWQRALEIDPQYSVIHYNLGLAYVELGEKNKAEEHFKMALLLDPECEECAQRLESLKSN